VSLLGRASLGALAFAAVAAVALASAAAADAQHDAGPRVLRVGTIAPDGTEWARLSRSFARGVEETSGGAMHVKFYFGGIAGDEMAELDRLRRGQLDGIAGSAYCERLAPSLRALEVAGMTQNGREADVVLRAIKNAVDKEMASTPYRALFVSLGFGHRVLFTRKPVRTLADLRGTRLWLWEYDDVLRKQLGEMGVTVLPMPIDQASRAYDEGRIDGFIMIPQAALAFQFTSQAKFFTDLETAFLPGCFVMKTASVDQFPYDEQMALLNEASKLKLHFEEAGARMDDQLLGTLFARQGLKAAPMSPAFRKDWFRESRAAYRKLRDELVPSPAGQQALQLVTPDNR
jgi:TRAP-type transport system periplasmic protein